MPPSGPGASPALPLTFDWEDWWQLCLPAFQDHRRFEDRLAQGTDQALAFCEDLGVRATWFCLADQAKRHPLLLRRIQEAGHELALHGLDHTRSCELGRAAFRGWLRDGKAQLEDLSGVAVVGFRAPEWSLRGRAAEYWEELPALGFRYDSSRAPLALLGDPGWPRSRHVLAPGLECFPPPVAPLAGFDVPLWGWGLRLLPGGWTRRRLWTLAEGGAGTPVVLHPWELDEAQPRLPKGTPRGHRFAHAAGLRGYGRRLRRILAGLPLLPIEAFLSPEHQASAAFV